MRILSRRQANQGRSVLFKQRRSSVSLIPQQSVPGFGHSKNLCSIRFVSRLAADFNEAKNKIPVHHFIFRIVDVWKRTGLHAPEYLQVLTTKDSLIEMSILSRLRCITIDVTGTLIAYKGDLGDYYCMAAKSVGLPCPDYKRMHEGFKTAYSDMAKHYPCFGHAAKMPNIVWWKTCVRDSFVRAGYAYDEETFEKVFKRIYSVFGSSAPYTIFPDSQQFLRWAREQGITVGIVSNAEYRYRDVILPALGLNQGTEWDFGVFSGLEGVEKPDPRIYEIALERAGNIAPEETLHIGDSIRKDYIPAKSVGMQALLLDRFKTPDAETWRQSGAPVLPDLEAAKVWLTSETLYDGASISSQDGKLSSCL